MYRIVGVCVLCVLACGGVWATECNSGEYARGETCVACPDTYPHSIPDADSISDCYLMTDAGKYVAGAGSGQTLCPENHYCPGGIPVAYDMRERFQRIKYIKSTGIQYINTGIILGSDIDTEIVFETGNIGPVDAALFGAHGADRHYWLNGYNNTVYIRYNDYHPETESKGRLSANIKHTLEIRHGDWILDGITIYSNSGVFNTGVPGYLFAVFGVADGEEVIKFPHESLKVFSFTQWRGDEKVIDLIPVYDSVRDGCGMLDSVTGKFFGNIGDGKFVCDAPSDNSMAWASTAMSCAVATDNAAPYSPAGSDDVLDCGYILRLGDKNKLYLRSEKRTSPALAVQVKNRVFYADTSPDRHGSLRVEYNGQTLSVYNMDVND